MHYNKKFMVGFDENYRTHHTEFTKSVISR